ncbi:Hpt domain-containing protein [Kiloniella litopenaei]|uniref:Hpt domain-containing protein n=1 Tax=Kiloniella litopenaei TaxID=1549748 RepID=UPI0012FED5A7|nr:Hpt domain-containing protein [Kiloniella litopenaei]
MSGTSQTNYADAELLELYRSGIEEDFSTLEKILSDIEQNSDRTFEAMDQARCIVHNMKGQGTSFGFPLMTRLGDSFYMLLKHQVAQRELHQSTTKLYEAHLKAMRSVIENEISGDGPEIFQQVAASLKEKVTQVVD